MAGGLVQELKDLAELKKDGFLNEDEFQEAKQRLLAGSGIANPSSQTCISTPVTVEGVAVAVTAPNPGDCDTAEKLLLKNDALEAKRRVMHAKRQKELVEINVKRATRAASAAAAKADAMGEAEGTAMQAPALTKAVKRQSRQRRVAERKKRLQESVDTAWHGIPSIGNADKPTDAGSARRSSRMASESAGIVREVHTKEQAIEKPVWKRVLLCALAVAAGISFTLRIHQLLEALLFCDTNSSTGNGAADGSTTNTAPLYPTRCFGAIFFVSPPAFTMAFLVIGRCFGISSMTKQLAESAWKRVLPPNIFELARQRIFCIFDTQDTREIKSDTVRSAKEKSAIFNSYVGSGVSGQNLGSLPSALRSDPAFPQSMGLPDVSALTRGRRRALRVARKDKSQRATPLDYGCTDESALGGITVSAAGKGVENNRVRII